MQILVHSPYLQYDYFLPNDKIKGCRKTQIKHKIWLCQLMHGYHTLYKIFVLQQPIRNPYPCIFSYPTPLDCINQATLSLLPFRNCLSHNVCLSHDVQLDSKLLLIAMYRKTRKQQAIPWPHSEFFAGPLASESESSIRL